VLTPRPPSRPRQYQRETRAFNNVQNLTVGRQVGVGESYSSGSVVEGVVNKWHGQRRARPRAATARIAGAGRGTNV